LANPNAIGSYGRTSVVKQAQFKFPLWVVGHSTLAYLLPGQTRNLSPQRLERRIEVEVVAVIQKIPAQIGDLHAGWNGNCHDDGKRRCFGVLGGIGAGLQFFDVDAIAREECRQVVHDAGTVRRHQFDGVGNGGIGRFAFAGALVMQGQFQLLAERGQLPFQLGERVPGTPDPQDERALATQGGHAAFVDVAAALADAGGQALDEAGLVRADGGDHQGVVFSFSIHVCLAYMVG